MNLLVQLFLKGSASVLVDIDFATVLRCPKNNVVGNHLKFWRAQCSSPTWITGCAMGLLKESLKLFILPMLHHKAKASSRFSK